MASFREAYARCFPPRRAPRMFTGSILPEPVAKDLEDFAAKYQMRSNIWIPRRLLVDRFSSHARLVRGAMLRDIALGEDCSERLIYAALGPDRTLVNASHTTNCEFFEDYSKRFLGIPPEDIVPLRISGAPIPEPIASRLVKEHVKCGYRNPYWLSPGEVAEEMMSSQLANTGVEQTGGVATALRAGENHVQVSKTPRSWLSAAGSSDSLAVMRLSDVGKIISDALDIAYALPDRRGLGSTCGKASVKRRGSRCEAEAQHWVNAEQTPFPGRFNPVSCVTYVAYDTRGASFPRYLKSLMAMKAVLNGYASHLWLTQQQGRRLGAELDPRKVAHCPPVFSGHATSCGSAEEFFCADQFVEPQRLPTLRQIFLRASGLSLGGPEAGASSSGVVPSSTVATTPSVPDPAFRGAAACQAQVYPFKPPLRPYALNQINGAMRLDGYPTSDFIMRASAGTWHLPLRAGESGLNLTENVTESCVFNFEQFEEPQLLRELVTNPPINAVTRGRFYSLLGSQLARTQLHYGLRDSRWVPAYVLDAAPFLALKKLNTVRVRSPRGIDGAGSAPDADRGIIRVRMKRPPPSLPSMTSLGHREDLDVVHLSCIDDSGFFEWLETYTPRSALGTALTGLYGAGFRLRAFEMGYTSPYWFSEAVLASRGFSVKPSKVPINEWALRGAQFTLRAPGVVIGSACFFNEEAIEQGAALLAAFQADRTHRSKSPGE